MSVFEISYYVLIGVLGVLSLVLMILPVKKDPRLDGYNMSLKLMALSFFSLALYCTFKWAIPLQLFSVYFLFMAHLQSNLLGLGHVNMLTPQKVTKMYVWYHFFPLIICAVVYAVVRMMSAPVALDDYSMLKDQKVLLHPEVMARVVWMIVYVCNTLYYGILFFREYRQYRQKAGNFYSESLSRPVRSICISFVLALTVAVTTLFITSSLNPLFSAVLNLCILLLYSCMGAFYIQYPSVFPTLEPVIYEEPEEETVEDLQWQAIRERIVTEEMYARPGVTLEQLSREMQVSRTRLSMLINQQEHMNFNSFINRLRIQKACDMLRANPLMRAAELVEPLGYTEQSNFARNFKAITGMTPKEYGLQASRAAK